MKPWLSRLPIRGKLLLLAAIVSCVALLISGLVLVYYAYDSSDQALRHRLQTQARITALNSAAALAFEDTDAAKLTLQALAGDTAILGAEIERPDGSPFVEHAFGDVSVEALHSRPDIVHAAADIVLGERIGRVHLLASKSELRTLLMRALAILALAALASLVVALLAASRLQRIISNPIVALANTAAAVSRTRDYTLRVAASSEDEVGELVLAFNDMLQQTEVNSAELRAYQAELEDKVASRTEQLASALKDAQAAAQAKTDFLANMSHEIRTPMNGVIGMLDLMDSDGLDVQRRGMLEIARNSAEALLAIINDVLDFSKIDAGKLTLEQIDLELLPLAEEVSTLFARQAHTKGVEVTCWVDASVPMLVRSDPVRLRQILANLLGNAIKFTEQGEVSLSVRCERTSDSEAAIEITIRDTGIGMSPSAVSRLFRSFTQADSSTTRKFGGTGLGLAITKGLVDGMRGTIEVTSEPGKGSVFTVTLPMMIVAQNVLPKRADLSQLNVLIVDDNATNRLVLEHYLEGLRVRSQSAASAQQGFEAAQRAVAAGRPFDMILLDYHMPEVDGFGFLRMLRAEPALAKTKCLVLSSMGDRPAGANELEIDAWLNKPVRQSQLYSAVAMVAGVSAGWHSGAFGSNTTQAPQAPGTRFAGRVLLVEDNVVNQQVASRLLAAFGIEAHLCVNGKEAVECVQQEHFDLVFMDCQMPVMDGYQAARAIREWESQGNRSHVTIVAMTANAMQGDRERCIAAGMDDYVSKPVKRDKLAAALSRWLTIEPTSQAAQTAESVHEQAPGEPNRSTDQEDALDMAAFEQLRELFDGDCTEIIDSYLRDSLEQLDTMKNAIAQFDYALLGRSAHSLKSSSRSLGAVVVGRLAEKLEMLTRSAGALDDASVLLTQLQRARAAVEVRLRNIEGDQQRASA